MRLPTELDVFLDKLVLNLYKLSKPSTGKELKEKDSSLPDPVTVGRGLSYLDYLGVVKRIRGKGIYELTDDGRKIGIELFQNQKEHADKLWKSLLKGHPLHGLIQSYIKEKGGGVAGSSIGLAEYLRDAASAEWKTGFLKAGGQRLCTIFSKKGLLTYDTDEDSIAIPLEQTHGEAPLLEIHRDAQSAADEVKGAMPLSGQPPSEVATSPALFSIDVKLNIEISKDTPPEIAQKTFDFLLKLSEKGIQINPTKKPKEP